MTTKLMALVLGCLVCGAVAVPAGAGEDSPCGSRSDILGKLKASYRESPVGMGLAANGGVIEVLTSAGRQTWSIIVTMPSGMSCMVAAGKNWENLPLVTADSRT